MAASGERTNAFPVHYPISRPSDQNTCYALFSRNRRNLTEALSCATAYTESIDPACVETLKKWQKDEKFSPDIQVDELYLLLLLNIGHKIFQTHIQFGDGWSGSSREGELFGGADESVTDDFDVVCLV